MKDETGWLIEKNICNRAHWWTGDGWSIDSLCAIRFSRKADAEQAIQKCILGKDCFATDHMWVGPEDNRRHPMMNDLVAGLRRQMGVGPSIWLCDNREAIADELERLSTPDILWDEDDGESAIDSSELADCFYQMGDGDERTFDCAKRLPKRVYRRVDKADGYDIVLVPDAKGGG